MKGVSMDNKLIDLCLEYNFEYSYFYIKHLSDRINFYEKEIHLLNQYKPLFFQKKRIKEYRLKKQNYLNKIFDCYKKIDEEYKNIERRKYK